MHAANSPSRAAAGVPACSGYSSFTSRCCDGQAATGRNNLRSHLRVPSARAVADANRAGPNLLRIMMSERRGRPGGEGMMGCGGGAHETLEEFPAVSSPQASLSGCLVRFDREHCGKRSLRQYWARCRSAGRMVRER